MFTPYSTVAIRDQQRMLTGGFNPGISDEAVRVYAQGHLPYVPLRGVHVDLLGDHFSPIRATLAPLCRLFPGIYAVLPAQAALLASAGVDSASEPERPLMP